MSKHLKVAIIDADLIGRDKHRFPNLVCEKLSAYWKEKGATVELLLTYDNFKKYDKIFISKVFTDTYCPDYLKDEKWLSKNPKVQIGGTGFYFDKAPNLPDEIEHHMPDYDLYKKWIDATVEKAINDYVNNADISNEFANDEDKNVKIKAFKEKLT